MSNQDMTGPEARERALLETFFEHAPLGFAFVDRELRFVRVNPVLAAIHGASPEELIGRRVDEVMPTLWPELEGIYRRVFAGEAVVNHDISGNTPQRPELPGHWLTSHYPVRLGGEVIGIGVLVNDITMRHEAEEARLAAEAYYRKLFDYAPDGIVLADAESTYLDANPSICRMLGYAREELVGLHASDIVSAGEQEHIAPAVAGLGQDQDHFREWQFRRKDGSSFSAEVIASRLPDGRLLGMIRDLSERRQADLRIRELNRVYAVLSEVNQAIVRERDPQAVIDAACRIAVEKGQFAMAWIGLRPEDEGGLALRAHAGAAPDTLALLRQMIGSEAGPCACNYTRQAFETGIHGHCADIAQDPLMEPWREICRERGYRSMLSLPLRLAERVVGTFNLYADQAGFFDDEEMALLDEMALDIGYALEMHARERERHQLEAQLQQVQKMDALGQLAGGVAHDFNNLLTIITGYSELMLRLTPAEDSRYELLREIIGASERSAALTRQLLAFSRKQVLTPRLLDLNAVVTDAESLLRRLLGPGIQLQSQLQTPLDPVRADSGQLGQVLLNLAVNARDAMPEGGLLRLATAACELAQPEADAEAGSYVVLSVSDTGIGMDAGVKRHLFEPFFTTKQAGTGLGLAVVHGIVSQSGGHIRVESEPGAGARFEIWLPGVRQAPEAEAAPAGAEPGHGSETILLVEDDAGVRALMRYTLQTQGYTVLEAGRGEEALALAQAQPIDLLLTDMLLPGIGGRQLAERLAGLQPETRVLYVSGFTDQPQVNGRPELPAHFLLKPFSPAVLAQKVREALSDN